MPPVPHAFVRIFSDLHLGDRASRLTDLRRLEPLLAGPTRAVFNGDTIDTRPSRRPEHGRRLREDVAAFLAMCPVPVTLLTGNHDPDIAETHALELAGGAVFVTHGDVLFDDIVPWSQDARLARRFLTEELSAEPAGRRNQLEGRLSAVRRAAIRIPQRHQSEPHGLKYALSFLADTVWPPLRVLSVIRAWREAPARADALVRQHRPRARFFVMGHTHRRGLVRLPGGLTVINTGAYCPPTAPGVVDVHGDHLIFRAVERRGSDYLPGGTLAEFSLAEETGLPTLPSS